MVPRIELALTCLASLARDLEPLGLSHPYVSVHSCSRWTGGCWDRKRGWLSLPHTQRYSRRQSDFIFALGSHHSEIPAKPAFLAPPRVSSGCFSLRTQRGKGNCVFLSCVSARSALSAVVLVYEFVNLSSGRGSPGALCP